MNRDEITQPGFYAIVSMPGAEDGSFHGHCAGPWPSPELARVHVERPRCSSARVVVTVVEVTAVEILCGEGRS